jgi:hypothetical protein
MFKIQIIQTKVSDFDIWVLDLFRLPAVGRDLDIPI